MPTNTAAWLTNRRADLRVGPARYTSPGPGQLVIRNRAVAINPLDTIKQGSGDVLYRWLPYPSILGEDVAGEVVEVGADVTRFRVGDRVLAYAVGMEKGSDHEAEGGFQEYTVVRALLTAPVPDTMSFEDAVVLPLAVSTAATALFQADQLGLRHPTAAPTSAQQSVVVWGASTSVGSNAIQLAVAAGYDVVTTASPHNHDRARGLGATRVFDYASPTVVEDVATALRDQDVVGVLAVGTGSAEPCVAIAAATGAKRVSMASPPVSLDKVRHRSGFSAEMLGLVSRMVLDTVRLQTRSRLRRIRASFVWGSTLMDNEVGPMLWSDYLPAALADARHVPSPAPQVIGTGLDRVQDALDALREGVSATKLVVRL